MNYLVDTLPNRVPSALRRKVLQIAFHCSPDHGSEWANGWHRALQSSLNFDTWVICYGEQQADEIRRYLENYGPVPGLHFEYVSHPACGKIAAHIHGRRWIAYRWWHQEAFRVAKRMHETIHFDLVHQVTNSGFREPGLLWKLDVPFIWGPIGGVHNTPWRFLFEAGLKHGVCEATRNLTNSLQLNWTRRFPVAARRASALLVANSSAREQIRRLHDVCPVTMLDVGIERLSPPRVREDRLDPSVLRILWSGQLVPRKALSLLLKSLASMPPDVSYHLRVIGGGKLEHRERLLAAKLGIANQVEWLGWLPHRECLRQYEWADVFAFTSLRDNSGTVVLEAMSNGLPVVCLDHQGVHDIVADGCGLMVPVTWPGKVVDDLSAALTRLARDPALRWKMSRAARERARDYLWSSLGEQLADVYRQALEPRTVEVSHGAAATIKADPPRPHWSNGAPVSTAPPAAESPQVAAIVPAPAALGVTTFPRNRFRDAITWAAQRAAVGLHTVFGDRPERGFGLLMYHRVTDWPRGVPTPTSSVTPNRFREQLEGVLSRGFEAWSLRKILDFNVASRPIPAKVFAVTFDDGYENNLVAAVPILEQLGVPATIFLATGFLDSNRPFPFDNWSCAGSTRVPAISWRPLTTRQCDALMAHDLIELGAHTHTHGAFANDVDAFQRDLETSIELLERRFGIKQPAFSFPFGVVNRGMIDAAKRSGAACGLTSQSECVRAGTDPFGWGRYSADDRDSVATLAAKLNGWYTPVAQVLRGYKRPLAAVAPRAIGELVPLSKPCFEPSAVRQRQPNDVRCAAHVGEYCEHK